MEDVKLAFVAEALNKYMQDVVEAMRTSIGKYDAIDTKTLYNSLKYQVYQRAAMGNANLSFAEWGRFLDMGVTRGNPIGGAKATLAKLKSDNPKKRKKKNAKKQPPKVKVKPKKIYSPIVYGHLNSLINTIAYGFTEETINSLKQTLQNNTPNV